MRLVETPGTHHRGRDRLRAAQGVDRRRASTCWRTAALPKRPIRSALHGYEIATVLAELERAAGARRRRTRRWRPTPRPRSRCTRGTGCTTAAPRRWAGCPPSRTCIPQPTSPTRMANVSLRLTGGQRLHRRGAARHGAAGVPGGLDGRARDAAVRAAEPGEHLEADVAVTMPPGTAPGRYPVRAQLDRHRRPVDARGVAPDRRGRLPDRRRRDAAPRTRAATGRRSPSRRRASPPARTARLSVTVGTDARADLAVEAHLISPWGTWEWMGPAARRRRAARPRPACELDFDVTPPPWVRARRVVGAGPGGRAGQLVYSPAVRVTVR